MNFCNVLRIFVIVFITAIGFEGRVALAQSAPAGFVTACGTGLCLDGEEFRFISLAAPELSMRENPYWDVANEFDQEDIIRTVAEMGGRVTRTYVLSVAGVDKVPVHIEGIGQYNEEAFQSLDRVLALANKHDVKIIIPFIDTWQWWGGIEEFSVMHGVSGAEFFDREVTKGAYKDLVRYVLTRVNTVTGVRYMDDPAVLAWETGNELRNSTTEWTQEMAAFIKSVDPHHLVMDGNDEHNDEVIFDDPNIDIITRHYYGADFEGRFRADMAQIAGRKPLIIGEFGLTSFSEISALIDAAVDEGAVGAMIWSLRNHDSLGGWHWHCEANGGCAYHFPGFDVGEGYNERAVVAKLQEAAWRIRGLDAPTPSKPDVPNMLPVSTPLDIQWRGVVGADSYDIERARDSGAWESVAMGVSDSVNIPTARYLRDVTDPQSGRLQEDALLRIILQDLEVETGEVIQYRVRAHGAGGTSDWSTPVETTIALGNGVRLVDPEDRKFGRTVARFSEEGVITRVEILTNADPVTTAAGCWPQIISMKEPKEIHIIDEPDIHADGAMVVSAIGAEFDTKIAIAQPCRGEVAILGMRYSFGDYDLDTPVPPERDLPVGFIDNFEIYGVELTLADRWGQNAGGDPIEIAVAGDGRGLMTAEYDLGTAGYAGVTRNLPRENWGSFSGVAFRYRGDGSTQGFTVQFLASSGYWETTVTAPNIEWVDVKIPFEEFAEPSWSTQDREQIRTGITELSIYVGGGDGDGMFQIDDIVLY